MSLRTSEPMLARPLEHAGYHVDPRGRVTGRTRGSVHGAPRVATDAPSAWRARAEASPSARAKPRSDSNTSVGGACLDTKWMPPTRHLVSSAVHSWPLRNRNAHRVRTRRAAWIFLRRNLFPALSTQVGIGGSKDSRDRPIQPLSHLSGGAFLTSWEAMGKRPSTITPQERDAIG